MYIYKQYESALWHWKSVNKRRTKLPQEEGNSSSSRPRNSNTGITIEFDIVPVKMDQSHHDGGTRSYSNASRHHPLLQLSSLRSSSPSSFVSPSSSSSSSKPPRSSSLPTNVNPLGKMTKDFNTYLVPIRARLSFPTLHHRLIHSGESSSSSSNAAHHRLHTDKSNYEKISQRLISVYFDPPPPQKNVSLKHHLHHMESSSTGGNNNNVSVHIYTTYSQCIIISISHLNYITSSNIHSFMLRSTLTKRSSRIYLSLVNFLHFTRQYLYECVIHEEED